MRQRGAASQNGCCGGRRLRFRSAFVLIAGLCVVTLPLGGCGQLLRSSMPEQEYVQEQPKVTLRLMQFKVEIADQVMAMAEDYMAAHPDVVIEAEVLKDYDTTLIARFAAGDAPDIFSIKPYTDMQEWSERLADLSGEPWMAHVTPAALPGMTVDGRQLGFPLSIEGYGFIYNKDLFAQAGITSVPRTLSELRAVNERLQAEGIASYAEGYKEWWILSQHLFNLPFAYEHDPMPAVQELLGDERQLTDLAHIDGFFEVLDQTLAYGKGESSIGISYDEQVSRFAAGETAMMQQGVWTISSIKALSPELNIGMFAIPLSDDPDETMLPVGVPGYYVVNKNSRYLEESKQFLSWLHENGERYLVDAFAAIPAFTDLRTSAELGPLAADLTGYADREQTIPWVHPLWPSGFIQAAEAPLQGYIAGGLTREETMVRLQAAWDHHALRD